MQKALEKRVEKLEAELKHENEKQITHKRYKSADFEVAVEQVFTFMEQPHTIWEKGDAEQQKLVQRLVFPRGIIYDYETGLGTGDLSLTYRLIQQSNDPKLTMVGMEGIEPTTKAL